MPHPSPLPNQIAQRSLAGIVTYWALNLALVGAEARWHILSRLTLYDLSQIKIFAPLLGKLLHPF